jgi:hypothetical protein
VFAVDVGRRAGASFAGLLDEDERARRAGVDSLAARLEAHLADSIAARVEPRRDSGWECCEHRARDGGHHAGDGE